MTNTAALNQLSLDGDGGDVMSPTVTRGALTLLSLSLAQGNCNENALAAKLVSLLNSASTNVRLPSDPVELVKALKSLDTEGVLMQKQDGGFVGRVVSLARISLSLSMGECFV